MDELIQALAVTAELTGSRLSEGAATVMVDDLSEYPLAQVLGALKKCRRELKGRLTIAEILSRLDDGRPGPEEAWAMLPFDEATTVVWTDEMARAFGVALPLIQMGDRVAGRMAFKEAYQREVAEARARKAPTTWVPSLGHDPHGREAPITAAVQAGRLTFEHAKILLPAPAPTITFEKLIAIAHQRAEPNRES